ncbi:hypothetical protein RHGRI_025600 [Rhododendron griersonianum]|uniref:Uncharacterized protein n=1 Tax=Rhododendron griersonianum TaxID=479676 RepID=A0AAV6IQZ6_9ERIC|nr:hypothetical protein RHGRI_025600 [Rhododendron griersonianum]
MVSTIIHQGTWKWPRTRSMATSKIVAQTPPTLIPNIAIPDSVRWILTKDGKFSANSAWQALRFLFLRFHGRKVFGSPTMYLVGPT